MDSPSTMDKKIAARGPQLPCKNCSDGSVKDYVGKKVGQQYVRKQREAEKPDAGRKPVAGRAGRTGQRYVRPREKTGGQVDNESELTESGSLFRGGGKKQNIAHLLDWWGPGHAGPNRRGSQQSGGYGGSRVRRYSAHAPKYNKEHYLQANCQFVVCDNEDYTVYTSDPDLLVEWRLVEEVRLHVSEAPACPICLHPPTAAKVTRCGHIYCFPCILHYLALSDKKWRKCPICYEAVMKEDLKSVIPICHKDYNIGEEIKLQLMRRERESLLPVPAASYSTNLIAETPRLSKLTASSPYAKLLLAAKEEVLQHILLREQTALEVQLIDEGSQPEACFIQAALTLLRERTEALFSVGSSGQDQLDLALLSNVVSQSEDKLFDQPPLVDDSIESLVKKMFVNEPPSPMEGLIYPFESSIGTIEKNIDISCIEPTLSFADLDISHLQPNNLSSGHAQKNGPKSTFYFYQAYNGANIFLHAINVQMLVKEYGCLENCPPIIEATILQKESTSMTLDLRQRLRYLRHLPVTCSFDVVEVALKQPLVSKATINEFKEQLDNRDRKRKKRAREERRIEKRVQDEEDRMLGRSKGAKLKLQSFNHFPAFTERVHDAICFEEFQEVQDSSHAPIEVLESAKTPINDASKLQLEVTGPGISFAHMIREGHAQLPSSKSEPVGLAKTSWPSLGAGPLDFQPLPSQAKSNWIDKSTVSSAQGSWGMKKSATFAGSSIPFEGNVSDEEADVVPVPEFKRAFSNAIAKALDEAAKKSQVNADEKEVLVNNNGRKKGKKKQKPVLLFSSGGLN